MNRWMADNRPLVVLLAGGAVLALALGIRQAFGLFLAPMSSDLGWGREVFAMAIAIQNILWGLTQPLFGAAADRWGGGRVTVLGGLLYAGGLWLMATADTPGMLYLSTGVMIGMALSGTSFAVVLGAIGRAYPPEKRSFALGIASAYGSFGQFALVPMGQAFIGSIGWQQTLVYVALLALVTVALAVPLSGKPQPVADEAKQTLRAALKLAGAHSGYLYLTAGFFVCGFHITFIATHMPAYLGDRGLTPGQGAAALMLIGLFNIVGSAACGWLGGRYSKKWTLSAVYLARSVIILGLLYLPFSEWTAYVFAASMGLLWLGTVPLTSGLVAQIFGPQNLGALFGIVFFSHQAGAFLGVWLGGYVFDLTGNYDPVWWTAIALGLLAALLHMPINEDPVVEPRAA